ARATNGGARAMSTILAAVSDDAISAAIEAAEEIGDPLEGLVENTAIDPGAACAPEILERLMALKRDDRAAFEALRAQLKKAGCRVTGIDGDALTLEADAAPPVGLADTLSRHKAGVIALLRRGRGGWSGEDWQ